MSHVASAIAKASKLGHLPLHQRSTLECARCGVGGVIDVDGKQRGKIFRKRCEVGA